MTRINLDDPTAFWPAMQMIQVECFRTVSPGKPWDEQEAVLAQGKIASKYPEDSGYLYESLRDKKITLRQYVAGFRELIEQFKNAQFIEELQNTLEDIQTFQDQNPSLKADISMTQPKLEIPAGSDKPSL